MHDACWCRELQQSYLTIFRSESSTTAQPLPLRYAVASLYKTQRLPDQVLADCYGVAAADVKAPKHRNYAVLLDDLQGKVVWVDASATSLQAPAGVVLARRYGCLTGIPIQALLGVWVGCQQH